jgi:hypothetical protein
LHQIAHIGEMGDRDDWIREIAELPFMGWFGFNILEKE